MVFAEDAKWFFSLHQSEEVICDGLAIEEVVDTQQEVPAGKMVGANIYISLLRQKLMKLTSMCHQKTYIYSLLFSRFFRLLAY